MPAWFGIGMTAFFLLLVPLSSFAEKLPGPITVTAVTLRDIAQQRAAVAQAFQASKDEQQKIASIEKAQSADSSNGTQQAGQEATPSQIRDRLTAQQQVLAQIQEEQNQADQNHATDFLNTQNQIVASQIDSQQQLVQIQGQIDFQRQSVAQLEQTIQTQRASNIDSPILDDALTQYQDQKTRLDDLEILKQNLAVQAGQAQMAAEFNQNQSGSEVRRIEANLQSQYAEAEKSYQQLQESYQAALAKEDSNRQKESSLDDEFKIEKEKQIALDDTYAREHRKLDKMITDFSKQ
jgi:hypothetical protein